MGSFKNLAVLIIILALGAVALEAIADLYLFSIVAFAAALALMGYGDRRNIKRESVLLLRRTRTGSGFIKRTGERFPRFWKVLGMLGVFFGFGASAYIIYLLIERFAAFLMAPAGLPPLGVVLPTPAATGTVAPGVLLVPFWYWIISIAVLVLVHEGLHGIMTAREKTRIKSLGWGLLAIIPIAFVEPDERQLEKRGLWPQLRVFAAGSWANFITAGVVLAILALLTSAVYAPLGVGFAGMQEGYPAHQANLTGVITAIGQEEIRTYQDLNRTLEGMGPGRAITIRTVIPRGGGGLEEKLYSLTTAGRPDNLSGGYIGVTGLSEVKIIRDGLLPYSGPILFIGGLLAFLFMINLGVGLFNLLPLKPLDGGKMWEVLIKRLAPKKGDMIVRGLGGFTLILLLLIFSTIPLSYI